MDDAELVRAHYSGIEESGRLHDAPHGVLERLRTWDLFERWLPPSGVVYDVGGAAGVHARWLAERGYHVELFDAAPNHVEQAAVTALGLPDEQRFLVEQADARRLPRGDASADVVLLLGPLYHLLEFADRAKALAEARRVLRPGGLLVAAGISRFSWLMDAYRKQVADGRDIQAGITYTVETGRSRATPDPGSFWAFFHRPQDLVEEIAAAGFGDASVAGVEGFAWMLPDLGAILARSEATTALLDQLRSTESEPSLLGVSAHLLARGTRSDETIGSSGRLPPPGSVSL